MNTARPSRLLFLLALALLTFLPMLGRRDIVTSHEARVVQTARQMAEIGWPWQARTIQVPRVVLMHTPAGEQLGPAADGSRMIVNPWIVPVMNGDIRLQKPPLPYWCTAILFRLIGTSAFTARLIPAVLGAISILLVWDLSRMLLGRVGAWYAALVWVSSYFIVDEFRKAMADPYLAFFTLAASWAWLRASRSEHPARLLIAFYALLALGTLAKGPIIFLFVPIILLIYHTTYRRSIPRSAIGHLIGIAVYLAISLPWAIAVLRSVPNAVELWRFESVGALSDKTENARPWWFYLPNLFLITLPWTPLWIMGLIYPLRFKRRRRMLPLLSMLLIVLIFSLSFAKKNAYLLPLMPVMSLLVAEGLRWLSLIPRRRPARTALMRTTWLAVVFTIAIQALVSIILADADNARSPREAAMFVAQSLQASPQQSLLYSRLPDEVTVYLPLNARETNDASEYLLIADDRKGEAAATARAITTTPAGPVGAVEEVTIPNAKVKRWKIYALKVLPVERPAPGAG